MLNILEAILALVSFFDEAGDDSWQLLVCILSVKLSEPLGSRSVKILLLRISVNLFDCTRWLVEDVLKLSISFGELAAELDIHIGCDGCSES